MFIANARMYSVTPQVEAQWQSLLARISAEAQVALTYWPYPAPQPLEHLWNRPDLGCVLMCGYPIALTLADVVPLAAPIPAAPWSQHRPLYRSDLIVRRDSPFQRLEDTFGHRAGWTVEHSHSGFNAFRHHLLAYRSPQRTTLYGAMKGNLVTARRILDCVRDGEIDIGPLDSYWHLLIDKYAPELTRDIRVLDATAPAPMPAFVAAPDLPAEAVTRLRQAFAESARQSWFAPYAQALLIEGFAPVDKASFSTTLARDQQAKAQNYPLPA